MYIPLKQVKHSSRESNPGKWYRLYEDLDYDSTANRVIGTTKPTTHEVLLDTRFELPSELTENEALMLQEKLDYMNDINELGRTWAVDLYGIAQKKKMNSKYSDSTELFDKDPTTSQHADSFQSENLLQSSINYKNNSQGQYNNRNSINEESMNTNTTFNYASSQNQHENTYLHHQNLNDDNSHNLSNQNLSHHNANLNQSQNNIPKSSQADRPLTVNEILEQHRLKKLQGRNNMQSSTKEDIVNSSNIGSTSSPHIEPGKTALNTQLSAPDLKNPSDKHWRIS